LPLRIEHYFPYPAPTPASLDTRQATLAWRDADDKPPNAVDPDDWAFSDCRSQPFPGTPDPGRVSLRAGFDPARAYELSYIAKDPKVLGVGFAATRDLIAFLRHGPDASNPVGGHIRWVVGFGVSQAGNFLRTFVHLGFNADTAGRPVFDGINPQIAARHVPLNVRFGAPGGAAGLHELGSEGVLWWSRYDDQARGRPPASLLDRANAAGVCPKVIESFGSAEFWGLRMSPALVGAEASEDVPLPANVRRYYFPGVTHGGALASGFDYSKTPDPGGPAALLPANPNPCFETVRILQQALIDWVRTGKEPPPSCYPTLAAGDLVAVEATGWPDIPDAPDPVGKLNAFYDYDVGPSFRYADLSGVPEFLPPRIRRTLRSLVPRVDADGNETAGIASVQLLAPLGTYTGWNVQAQGYGAGGPCGFFGGFIPFAESKAERLAAGDPRLSLEERYGDHGGFVAAVRAAVADRLAHGWLAEDDAARLISKAEASLVLGGAYPYQIGEGDTHAIEDASELFEGESLTELLAGAANTSRGPLLDWVHAMEGRRSSASRVGELAGLARATAAAAPPRPGEESWALGCRRARAMRAALQLGQQDRFKSFRPLAEKLGAKNTFELARPVDGIRALRSDKRDGVHIHMRSFGASPTAPLAHLFNFARAVGDAACFPEESRAPINELQSAYRQAAGRAFAAEFLAPINEIKSMQRDRRDVDTIAAEFGVSTTAIERQIENAARIEAACA